MKKNDIILIAVLLVLASITAGALRIWQMNNTKNGASVVVTIDGQLYGTYPLSEERTERIELPDGSYNILTISEGYADITEASCPDQICVKHNHIRYTKESIVCLPNKVVVTVEDGDENEIDSTTF